MASARGAPAAAEAPVEEDGGGSKRDVPEYKEKKNFVHILTKILIGGEAGYREAEKAEHLKKETLI
eukprot:3193585-Karenia_brevis.AAC.1